MSAAVLQREECPVCGHVAHDDPCSDALPDADDGRLCRCVPCSECRGTGAWRGDDGQPCAACHGQGVDLDRASPYWCLVTS